MKLRMIHSAALDGAPGATDPTRDEAEVVFVMPCIDQDAAARCARRMASRAGASGLLVAVLDAKREGFIAVANRVFRLSRSRYFGYVAQDAFAGRGWLALALQAMNGRDQARRGLFAFNDGKWMGALAAFGMSDRAWAQRNYGGDLFFPGYRRHYADAELTALAIDARSYCYDPNSLLIELDWAKEYAQVDEGDRALFRRRKAASFDGRVLDARVRDMFN